MTNNEDLTLLFTGSEIDAGVLKDILEDNGSGCFIRNDMNSAKAAGFGITYGSGSEANLFVMEKDLDKAKELLEEFKDSFDKD